MPFIPVEVLRHSEENTGGTIFHNFHNLHDH